jgi:hypothetical protein
MEPDSGAPDADAPDLAAALPFRGAPIAPTDRLAIGATGLAVSPICLGLVRDRALIPAAARAGINFFFVTTDMHWPAYEECRRGLAALLAEAPSLRRELVIAGTCYLGQPEFLSTPFRELVDAVPGLGGIDLLVAGGAYADNLLSRLEVLRGHVDRGFVGARAIGASFHDRAAARVAIAHGLVDVAYVRYSARHPKALVEVLPHKGSQTRLFGFNTVRGHVATERLGPLGVGEDLWRPTVADQYRFALSRAAVDGVLCALSSPAELSALVAALAEGPLSPDEEQYLLKLALLDRGAAVLA